jgi:NAD(P)-dependent dehydrogenase (short-subunit alcohol dehydrogenase family)
MARRVDNREVALAEISAVHPIKRLGTASDIANLVAFLASDLASFITGANYVIDGGLTACLKG